MRPLEAGDAASLARLLAASRAFMVPLEPERPDRFYSAEGVRASLEKALEDDEADR